MINWSKNNLKRLVKVSVLTIIISQALSLLMIFDTYSLVGKDSVAKDNIEAKLALYKVLSKTFIVLTCVSLCALIIFGILLALQSKKQNKNNDRE